MANYYCLMAGLPDIELSDTKPGYSSARLRRELQSEMGRRDERLLRLLFLEHDCRNLLALLRNPEAELEEEGNYSREQLNELTEDARSIDLGNSPYPQFMLDFVRSYDEQAGRDGYFPEDEVLTGYYSYCTAHCPDSLMRRWYQLNFDVTNIMTAMIARKQGWRVGDFVKGDGEVQETIRTSETRDFGLKSVCDYFPEIMKIVEEADPVRKERMLDAFKWMWLEEQTFGDTFSIQAVFAYLCKLQIQERWARLDVEQGKKAFEKIIADLRSEAEVPEEFKQRGSAAL